MAIREKLEQHKGIVSIIVPVVILGSLAYGYMTVRQDSQLSGPVTQAYFTDDEGKTFFADSLEKAPPFNHDGKQAYRAYVFKCDEKAEPFVGLLGRAVNIAPNAHYAANQSNAASTEMEVCKPGTKQWVAYLSPQGQNLLRSVCASGSPISVQPGQ